MSRLAEAQTQILSEQLADRSPHFICRARRDAPPMTWCDWSAERFSRNLLPELEWLIAYAWRPPHARPAVQARARRRSGPRPDQTTTCAIGFLRHIVGLTTSAPCVTWPTDDLLGPPVDVRGGRIPTSWSATTDGWSRRWGDEVMFHDHRSDGDGPRPDSSSPKPSAATAAQSRRYAFGLAYGPDRRARAATHLSARSSTSQAGARELPDRARVRVRSGDGALASTKRLADGAPSGPSITVEPASQPSGYVVTRNLTPYVIPPGKREPRRPRGVPSNLALRERHGRQLQLPSWPPHSRVIGFDRATKDQAASRPCPA